MNAQLPVRKEGSERFSWWHLRTDAKMARVALHASTSYIFGQSWTRTRSETDARVSKLYPWYKIGHVLDFYTLVSDTSGCRCSSDLKPNFGSHLATRGHRSRSWQEWRVIAAWSALLSAQQAHSRLRRLRVLDSKAFQLHRCNSRRKT